MKAASIKRMMAGSVTERAAGIISLRGPFSVTASTHGATRFTRTTRLFHGPRRDLVPDSSPGRTSNWLVSGRAYGAGGPGSVAPERIEILSGSDDPAHPRHSETAPAGAEAVGESYVCHTSVLYANAD
jgi:hypothetical protein